MGLKIVSDMQQGHLRLSTGDKAIFLATVTSTGAFFKYDMEFRDPPHLESPEGHNHGP